ncbi:hypothetical protein RJ639_016718 [Escallonia herrerae]|uniref:LysM domain-containing protein n=1 Tax=Escallonia herrerae TaxID=1293975 RepID=A0AA88VGV7_9ASTE|nr:hypothetical protein RJ639_016718 [Escallonia herrerae]
MPNHRPVSASVFLTIVLLLLANAPPSTPKSTIEPCSNADTCSALLGYTLYTDLKASEVASLFQIDPISLLTANSIDISYPDVENHILPSNLFLKIPITCSCADGIRKSTGTRYRARPSDTLASVATSLYGGLVSADQIKEANGLSDPSVLDVGQTLLVPLPCTCFNGTDNGLPAIYMSYVVKAEDSLGGIAARYSTTLTDLMTVNALGGPAIKDGDILAIPLSACASKFPRYASDYALTVPAGSYAITASHCVQCSCTPGSRTLYCMPASLAVSCSSMQCRNSNLMLGNVTMQQSSAGCNVTSCTYGGFVNGTIYTSYDSDLVLFILHSDFPKCEYCISRLLISKFFNFFAAGCPHRSNLDVQYCAYVIVYWIAGCATGPQQFPPLTAPPTALSPDSLFAPAPSPSQSGGSATNTPTSVAPASGTVVGFPPANGPTGSFSGACSLVNPLGSLRNAIVLALILKVAVSFSF